MTKDIIVGKSRKELIKLLESVAVSDSPKRFTVIKWIEEELNIRDYKNVLVESSEFEGVD